ncbi:MAG: RNA polymerase sigma factor [Planctomycetes bacterium]|nr:RNA polymerase sigma factor [Planctomycetota bacterium]
MSPLCSDRSDQELFLAYKSPTGTGAVAAFEELLNRYQQKVLNFFYRLTFNKEVAEDLTQDTFTRLVQSAREYQPRAAFKTFLFSLARNAWSDYRRCEENRRKSVSLETKVGDDADAELKDFIKSDGPAPQEIVVQRENIGLLKKYLDNLSPEQRITLELCVFQELSYEEAGMILEIPLGTVKTRVSAAIMQIKKKMEIQINK